ncbi:hypothetical protein [Halorubellus litoreus]|uniref:C2H2-type domain-containing protein n=1 Tax=Halorubellus litoreus TaxID=755308 RepID=A0ABD5VLB5_9EURY
MPDGGRPASGKEECGSCGKLIEAGTTYCPHCGTHERDRGSDGGSGSDRGSSGGSSRRTATVSRRDDGGDGGSPSGSSSGGSSRSTSNFAGGKSGREGFDERRRNRDSGRNGDAGRGDSGGRSGGASGREGSARGRGDDGKRGRDDGRRGRGGGSQRDRDRSNDRGDRSGRSGGSNDRGDRSGRSSNSGGRGGRGGSQAAQNADSSGSSGRGGGTDRGGRDRSGSESPGSGGRRMPDDDEEFCAACGEIIDASASVCPSCGDEREVASASSSSAAAASESTGSSDTDSGGSAASASESSSSGRSGGGASSGSPSTSTSLNNPSVNGWRWKIGWQPKKIIVGLTILGAIVGAMLEYIGQFAFFGLVVGVLVWFWGRGEVNAKYMSLIQDFRDQTRSKVERETGGMSLSSAHTFIGGHGSSPIFIEPSKKYKASHLLFGDTSVVINRQYHYKMPPRDTTQGGKQQEVFYDQIANVQSEDFANYAELQISLSSGQTERIKGRDTSGINAVKRDLQQKMREARR